MEANARLRAELEQKLEQHSAELAAAEQRERQSTEAAMQAAKAVQVGYLIARAVPYSALLTAFPSRVARKQLQLEGDCALRQEEAKRWKELSQRQEQKLQTQKDALQGSLQTEARLSEQVFVLVSLVVLFLFPPK